MKTLFENDREKLKKRRVCSDHFLSTDFTSPERNRLLPKSVPIKVGAAEAKLGKKSPDHLPSDNVFEDVFNTNFNEVNNEMDALSFFNWFCSSLENDIPFQMK